MSSPEHKQKVWNLIKDIKTGMLVTQENNESDRLRARPMSLVQDAYDGTLYFYTSKKDAKVYEIKNDRDVCITFSDPDEQVYVSLTGKARLSHDQELIDRYWNSWVSAWFEEGKEDPEVAMLVVKINKGEHWNADENKLIQLFEIAKANLKDEAVPDIGENEKFGN
ncbi:pyridoxamine 5'-phosphate oxidase family protein [Robertkochia aurantiaca]|uniref:pyridoxamine 5'-phosphate oxidase family protein n=1 Tax=Robertkochia aurantiaca TaxID=2873700 RepID=UPI001CCCD4BF|nr:pyridoxamine 5'-phosphate oxidase family protein [Robertkochia sp. 3YJGBD-33]